MEAATALTGTEEEGKGGQGRGPQSAIRNPQSAIRNGPVVAKIGNREITQGELEKKIAPGVSDPAQQFQALQQYVLRELLYNAAKRRGLDRDKDVTAQTFEFKKDLMAQHLLREELGQVQVSDQNVELYYQAHRDRYVERKEGAKPRQKTLAEIRPQVEADLRQERMGQAQQGLLQKLLKAENAQIFAEQFPQVTPDVGREGTRP
jgi:peptidyl-prolyl cis-trans isomerase C